MNLSIIFINFFIGTERGGKNENQRYQKIYICSYGLSARSFDESVYS